MCLIFIRMCGFTTADAAVKVGFIYLGGYGTFTSPALGFAIDTFNTTELGKHHIISGTLKKYSVVWWHEGDSDPGDLSTEEISAFMDYAESGGAILLTGRAIRYVTPMGLEDAEPRLYGPMFNDDIEVGITVLKKTVDLDLVKGLKNIDGKVPKFDDMIQVNSTGYPKTSDYLNLWENFTTLAHVWGPLGINWGDKYAAFGYWKAGDGKVFNMSWRLPNFHVMNKSINQLEQLTENVINWLASESEYLDVSSHGKLSVVWGKLKNQR